MASRPAGMSGHLQMTGTDSSPGAEPGRAPQPLAAAAWFGASAPAAGARKLGHGVQLQACREQAHLHTCVCVGLEQRGVHTPASAHQAIASGCLLAALMRVLQQVPHSLQALAQLPGLPDQRHNRVAARLAKQPLERLFLQPRGRQGQKGVE